MFRFIDSAMDYDVINAVIVAPVSRNACPTHNRELIAGRYGAVTADDVSVRHDDHAFAGPITATAFYSNIVKNQTHQ